MNNVFFAGWVDQSRLLGYTRHASCGVIPIQPETLHLRYCTPNKLYEFLEARLPICASDMPELRRFVEASGIGAVYDLSRPSRSRKRSAISADGWRAASSAKIAFARATRSSAGPHSRHGFWISMGAWPSETESSMTGNPARRTLQLMRSFAHGRSSCKRRRSAANSASGATSRPWYIPANITTTT